MLSYDCFSFVYHSAYTIPVKFGVTQQFSLQIDTGSSDLVSPRSSSLAAELTSLLVGCVDFVFHVKL
jgi:hypothetical protein